MTIIAGDPGLGKSQITAGIAATVTTGGRWPFDTIHSEQGRVLFINAEDDPSDTIRPRLEAAGADLKMIHIVEAVRTGRVNGMGEKSQLYSPLSMTSTH